MQQPFPQPFMQVTKLPLYTAFIKEDHKSCRNLEWFLWLGFHRTGSSGGRTCLRTWTFAWLKGLMNTYEGTVDVISGDWMLNSPSSVLAIITDNYFNNHFFPPYAQNTNCYVTDTWNAPCGSNNNNHSCRFTNVVSTYRCIIWIRSHGCDDSENLYTCMKLLVPVRWRWIIYRLLSTSNLHRWNCLCARNEGIWW